MTEEAVFYLQYPFRHTFSDSDLITPPLPASSGWKHWYSRLTTESFAVATDHSFSFIPPVRAMLHPELTGRDRDDLVSTGLPGTGEVQAVRETMAGNSSNWRRQYSQRSLRLTWTRDNLWIHRALRLEPQDLVPPRHFGFEIDWIDVILFPDHVGVLLVKVRPHEATTDEAAIMARYIKKIVYRRRLTVDLPTIRQSDGGRTSWVEILKILLPDLTASSPLNAVTTSSHGVNWDLAVIASVSTKSEHSFFNFNLGDAAFCIAIGRPSSRIENEPTPTQVASLRRDQAVEIWDSWFALYHYDNLIMTVDTKDERLTREFRSHQENFEHEYVLLFAITLAQQAALDLLSTQIASVPPDTRAAHSQLEQLEGDLVRFNTRLWFDQVGTTPVGVPLYSMLARALHLDQYQQRVFADADRLRRHLDARRLRRQEANTRRTESLLQFLTIVALPLTVIVTLLAPRLIETPLIKKLSTDTLWEVTAGSILLLAVIWWIARARGSKENDDF